MIQEGDIFSHEFSFSQEQVRAFAEVTGDSNPIHLDAEYASQTPFKQPIIHGMLGAAVFSKVFGTLFPGEGTVYLGQTLQFKRPMYVDTPYVSSFQVTEIDRKKHQAKVRVEIKNAEGRAKVVLDGEALVMHAEKI
ncbi:MAG: MaoC family dehydratase [Cytophagales bacterium]|nr:MaoC family dehydratase [Cytophagales bacterium]